MLQLTNLKYSFGTEVIFDNVELALQQGKTYGIVGSNGVGKTTLFRVLAQIYKPKKGEVTWNGSQLSRQDISFLPTDPYFYPYMKGREYLEIVIQDQAMLAAAIEMTKSLNLNLDQLVDYYSTGMKKKLAFVANHSLDRPIAIYDEPFNGVDLESNELIVSYLNHRKEGRLTLISSHILSMLDEVCDEIIHIEKGFHMTRYQPEEFPSLKIHIKAGLGI